MTGPVYLDHAATTPADPEIRALYLELLETFWANPSSLYGPGVAAAARLEAAREELRGVVGSRFRRVIFTSGGTEANNLAVLGIGRGGRRRRIVVSAVEHASILGAAEAAAQGGAEVVRLPVGPAGEIDAGRLAEAARGAALVALHLVHNELGTVTDLEATAAALEGVAPEAHLHLDAVQALGKLDLRRLPAAVRSVSVSSHKVHGPKGVGALLVDGPAPARPLLFGGDQQERARPGTENVPGAAAFAAAARRAEQLRPGTSIRLAALDRRLLDGLAARALPLRPLASASRRVPGLVGLGLTGWPSEVVLHRLEARGVFCSAGSACHASRPRSHVLDALGVPAEVGMIRVSMGRGTTEADVDRFLEAVEEAVR